MKTITKYTNIVKKDKYHTLSPYKCCNTSTKVTAFIFYKNIKILYLIQLFTNFNNSQTIKLYNIRRELRKDDKHISSRR